MGRAPAGRRRRINPFVSTPKLEDEFYAYQPRTDSTYELLYAFHHWSGLTNDRHAVSITYIGDLAGICHQKNVTQIQAPGKAVQDRFDLHLAEMNRRGILIGSLDGDVLTVDMTKVRDHLERLTGHRCYHCHACRTLLPPGAIFCNTGDGGCGTPVPSRPARAVAATT